MYDGTDLIGEYSTGGAVLRRYVHSSRDDDPQVWLEGAGNGNISYVYTNYQGSVIATTNAAGSNLQIYKYSPYGEPRDASNNAAWSGFRFRYTGQQILPEARLYHYKARAYDPVLGTFLQTDPIGSKDDLDLYAYVGGDPVNKGDPTGLEGQICNAWGCYNTISDGLKAEQQKQTEITKQISNQNAKELAMFYGSAAVGEAGFSIAAKGLGIAYEGVANYRRFAPLRAGIRTEKAVLNGLGLAKNTKMYNGVIPDAVTKSAFIEVKDRSSVYATNQLRSMSKAAHDQGKEFILYTRSDTYISANARKLFNDIQYFQK